MKKITHEQARKDVERLPVSTQNDTIFKIRLNDYIDQHEQQEKELNQLKSDVKRYLYLEVVIGDEWHETKEEFSNLRNKLSKVGN